MTNPIERLEMLKKENSELAEVLNAIDEIDRVYSGFPTYPLNRPENPGTTRSANFSVWFPSYSATSITFEGGNITNGEQQTRPPTK